MIVQNDTENTIFYSISSPGTADCGSIDAGNSQEAKYDNTANVTVGISPEGTSVFSVVIPETGTGTVVTVGMYFG